MRRPDRLCHAVLAALLAACATSAPPSAPRAAAATRAAAPTPPVAARVPHPQTLSGHELADDYFWLRQKDTPEVLRYLAAENAYTDELMKPTAKLQQTLYDEMVARIQQTDVTVPYRKGGYFYYVRTVEGQEYPILCRKSAAGVAADDLVGATAAAPEQVLLDLNELGKTQKFVGLGPAEVSDDARTLAYGIDATGFRQFTLRFKDLTTGAVAPESIPRVDAVAWPKDNRTLFYVVDDETAKRPYRLYRHVVGSDPGQDALVYEEKDGMFVLTVDRTRSGAYLVAHSVSKTTSEARVLPADRTADDWRVVEPRRHDHLYFVDHRGRDFIIRTNAPAEPGGAKALNFRLVTAPVADPGRAHWKEIVPHRADVMLEGVEVFTSVLVLRERADALPRLRVLTAAGKSTVIPMPEALYSVFPDENPEPAARAFRFHYQSPVTPDSVYDYDLQSGALTLRKRQEVKGGFDAGRYQTARVHAVAGDGTRIPISLVYRKGPARPAPILLYGYGSYGYSLPLTFQPDRISLLDRGVVFAIAHIRGGGDLGKAWHEQGRMATKMNTFTDFIACAEELVHGGWTARDRLVIMGGSAGGLLMGAVTNLRPDLWHAVVAQVPFVDVINTMLDESLPLTVGEFEEWGNPKHPDELETMLRYSPYDNVTRQDYPAMLVETSYNDSQVMYWEPAKYVAKLRALKTDANALVFRVRMEPAGHGGSSGRYQRFRETAFTYAFILTQLGIRS